MASPALPLSDIVNVTVLVNPQGVVAPQFNVACIIGPSTIIPSVGANSRIRTYSGLAGMLTDGFTSSSPEYLAAQLYFGQSPAPQQVQIGRQDLTALKVIIPHAGSAGSGYAVGDIIVVTQGGASGGNARVTTIGGGGAVTGLSVLTAQDGTGYSVAASLATTTTGAGIGLLVDITAIGETPLVAVQNCRAASSLWWAVMVTSAVIADATAIAAYVAAMQPVGCYFHTTSDAAVLNNTAGNLAATLQAANYTRVFLVYSTTQSGLYPNNAYACAAAMGLAMGLNTGLANSNFTLMFKIMTGVNWEPLTQVQVNTLTGINCNFYVEYNNAYTILQSGTSPQTNTFFDQVLNRDVLAAAIQYAIMNVLIGSPSVPQTDPGQTQLIHAVNQACQSAVNTGYLAPGIWTGVTILGLSAGNPVPAGFLAQSPPYRTQSTANKLVRQSMPIYVAILEAGSAQSVVIGVYIQP